jgi:hypothetical protein
MSARLMFLAICQNLRISGNCGDTVLNLPKLTP